MACDVADLIVVRGQPSVPVLSPVIIVAIFLIVPMDSNIGLLRIERLDLPARAAFVKSMDAAS